MRGRIWRAAGALLALWLLGGAPGMAAEPAKLRVGTPAEVNFTFLPLTVGQQKGFFAREGLDVDIVAFQGGSRLAQGMTAGDVDLAVTSGTDMAFSAKGVPDIAVAATAGPPLFLSVIVPYDSPLKGPDDLKGKTVAVTTEGSFTAWLMRRLVQEKRWSANDMTLVAVGANPSAYAAALKTHQVDAAVQAPALGFQLEEQKVARPLFATSLIVKDFLSNAIFARRETLAARPDDVRRFIKAWFAAVAFMRGHKAETVAISRALNHYDEAVAGQEYDTVMPMFLADGHFDRAALKVLQSSFVDMGLFKDPPDMSALYTEAYLPK
ncbi:MAG TPA: ABC transporter substrate-binding protein [Stellaceae bacterium]|nr:ABC transporter substrate-binding protein [Stellaceae bacterium]